MPKSTGSKSLPPTFHIDTQHGERLETIRQAIGNCRKLRIDYADAAGKPSQRVTWPLALYFWGGAWSIAAWCEMRGDFRNFRLDRLRPLDVLTRYLSVEGRRLPDFVRAIQQQRRSS